MEHIRFFLTLVFGLGGISLMIYGGFRIHPGLGWFLVGAVSTLIANSI